MTNAKGALLASFKVSCFTIWNKGNSTEIIKSRANKMAFYSVLARKEFFLPNKMDSRAEEEVFKAGKELDNAREELKNFKADNPNAFFDIEKKEYLTFLTQQVKDREEALKDREAALKDRAAELNDREAALIKLAKVPQTSSTKQSQYKGMSVESSCRKFLDALAKKISELYDFDTVYERNPTMGDVLKAKDGLEGTDWEYRIKRKKQLTSIPLPDMYSKEDWDELSRLNRVTTLRIHDARLPTTSQGKPFIILSHSDYNDAHVKQLKLIAATANLVFDENELIIKDEGHMSSSSSDDTSPTKQIN
jgi:hypothetical protein